METNDLVTMETNDLVTALTKYDQIVRTVIKALRRDAEEGREVRGE